MTKQETFNQIVRALILQNCVSQNNRICMYRDSCGRKCAVGHVIPDHLYEPEMEGKLVTAPLFQKVLAELDLDLVLLIDLQLVHDRHPVDMWRKLFRQVAQNHGLDDTVTYMYRDNQEIFDTVAKHLLQQNARAISTSGHCRYRTEDGKKCAVGALIPDHLYDPKLEGKSVLSAELTALRKALNIGEEIASKLQIIHDYEGPQVWPRELSVIAEAFGLDTSILSQVQND